MSQFCSRVPVPFHGPQLYAVALDGIALSVPGPGRYFVHVNDEGQSSVKPLDGYSIVNARATGALKRDVRTVAAALADLAARMRIVTGEENLSAVAQPLQVALSKAAPDGTGGLPERNLLKGTVGKLRHMEKIHCSFTCGDVGMSVQIPGEVYAKYPVGEGEQVYFEFAPGANPLTAPPIAIHKTDPRAGCASIPGDDPLRAIAQSLQVTLSKEERNRNHAKAQRHAQDRGQKAGDTQQGERFSAGNSPSARRGRHRYAGRPDGRYEAAATVPDRRR